MKGVLIMNFGNVVIFGDSYSTFNGYIPEGYASYYFTNEGNTDVRRVEETWWHQLMSETGSNLLLNNSWSGSTVCHLGYNNVDASKINSFIYRLEQLRDNGFFEKNVVDTVFMFGGTNDSWSGDPLGEVKFDNWTTEDLYCVLPALSYFVKLLKDTAPKANIICLVNTELKPEIGDMFAQIGERYGVQVVAFDEIDKQFGHPTIKGMAQIKDKILASVR